MHNRSEIASSIRYSVTRDINGGELPWIVFDHVAGRNVETQLDWDEAHALVDELTGQSTAEPEDELCTTDWDSRTARAYRLAGNRLSGMFG